MCLLRPISVLVSKIDTVYHKSRYWSCILRPKLFQSWSQSCLVRLILLSLGLGLECKNLVSQISAIVSYATSIMDSKHNTTSLKTYHLEILEKINQMSQNFYYRKIRQVRTDQPTDRQTGPTYYSSSPELRKVI